MPAVGLRYAVLPPNADTPVQEVVVCEPATVPTVEVNLYSPPPVVARSEPTYSAKLSELKTNCPMAGTAILCPVNMVVEVPLPTVRGKISEAK